jgi:hypothetical protein
MLSWVVFLGRADMPAYIHQHDDIEPAFVICPSCVGLPMYVRDVEPHWSMAKIDFTYECADCGAEVRRTVVKPGAALSEIRRVGRAKRAHHYRHRMLGGGHAALCPPYEF